MRSNHRSVALVRSEAAPRYASQPPFDPDSAYPELPFQDRIGTEPNPAYAGIRESLRQLGYDAPHFASANWNPLGWLVQPGNSVFLKPNMIAHKHQHNDDWEYVITHGSVIRAVIDYVFIALKGDGRIVVGDAPQTDSNFERIVELMGLRDIQRLYRERADFPIDIIDLRDEHWLERDGIYVETEKLRGDPAGSIVVDLAGSSAFAELDGQGKVYYGAYYDVAETNAHHRDGKHEYAISRSPVIADVFINLPKLKTHKKCGITVNLKGLVGINANKNWLPHYAVGAPSNGGDQFDRDQKRHALENQLVLTAKRMLTERNSTAQFLARKAKRLAYKFFGSNEEVVRSGNWHGNDTVWRMCLDLNRILMYSDGSGNLNATRQKRFFSFVDGIIAMEGNGPVAGTPKPIGTVLAGANPVAVDAACSRLMGFDLSRIPLIARAFETHEFSLVDFTPSEISVVSNHPSFNRPLSDWSTSDLFHFRPHFGWTGRVELESEQVTAAP